MGFMAEPARIPLIATPTQMHRLPRASEDLGIDLWIKRDDLTGFAGGGNKGRKLEYLMAEALAQGAEVIVSGGSTQSNYLRQLSCACQMFGIHCVGATMKLPFVAAAGRPVGKEVSVGGNRVLDEMFGLEMRVFPDDSFDVLKQHVGDLVAEFEAQGKKVLRWPNGGSTPLGAYGYYKAGEEADAQIADPFDFVFAPSSSGATHAGLAYYYHGSQQHLIGISCDPEPDMDIHVAHLARGLDEIVGRGVKMKREDIDFRMGYQGPGYGVHGEEGDAAFDYLMKMEGVLLDPIYSAKTFAGLLDLARRKEISGRVLFWHTGGLPTLFATA